MYHVFIQLLFSWQGLVTPLIWGCFFGHLDITNLLLCCGANVNAQDRVCVKCNYFMALFTVGRQEYILVCIIVLVA